MARLSSMLELDDKLAGGAAAKAEAAAAEGAAKAKEEALAKAREAACSHECTHLKGMPRATWCTPVFWSCARVVCGGLGSGALAVKRHHKSFVPRVFCLEMSGPLLTVTE